MVWCVTGLLNREDERGDEDVCREDDKVHNNADACEVREAVASRDIDEHVCRRAYRGGET